MAVETPDAARAKTLVERLVRVVGGEAVSMEAGGDEVAVAETVDTRRALVQTLDAIEAWLDEVDLDYTRVCCGGRTYTLER